MAIKLYKYPEITTIQVARRTKAFLRKNRIGKESLDKTIRRLIRLPLR